MVLEIEEAYGSWPDWYAVSEQHNVSHYTLEALLHTSIIAYLYDLNVGSTDVDQQN